MMLMIGTMEAMMTMGAMTMMLMIGMIGGTTLVTSTTETCVMSWMTGLTRAMMSAMTTEPTVRTFASLAMGPMTTRPKMLKETLAWLAGCVCIPTRQAAGNGRQPCRLGVPMP